MFLHRAVEAAWRLARLLPLSAEDPTEAEPDIDP